MRCETCKNREWCPDKTMIPCKSYTKDQGKVERLKATKEADRKETVAAIKIATAFVAVVIVWLYLPSWMPWLY